MSKPNRVFQSHQRLLRRYMGALDAWRFARPGCGQQRLAHSTDATETSRIAHAPPPLARYWEIASMTSLAGADAASAGPGATMDALILRLVDVALLGDSVVHAAGSTCGGQTEWLANNSDGRLAALQGANYRASKPIRAGSRVQRVGTPESPTPAHQHGSKQYGVVSSVQDSSAGPVASLAWCVDHTYDGSGESETIAVSELTTGNPNITVELGIGLGSLPQQVVWAWPEQIEESQIAFHSVNENGARGEALNLLETTPSSLLLQDEKSLYAAFHRHPVAPDDYVLSAFQILVDGEAAPMFVWRTDAVTQKSGWWPW